MKKLILSTAIALTMTSAHAATAVVSVANCQTLANTTQPFILVLDKGDEILSSISACAKAANLKGAIINGIGQLHNPVLAYFTSNPTDKPTLKQLHGYFELASLTGNVSVNDKDVYTHAHVALADSGFHGIAGHLNKSLVGLTAEITIIPTAEVTRAVDPKTGFGPLVH